MKPQRLLYVALLLGCAVIGAIAGRLTGPTLANFNYIVQVARDVAEEEANQTEDYSLRGEAFRTTGLSGMVAYWETRGIETEPTADEKEILNLLFNQAHEIRSQFRTGGTWFGLWCGLVVGASIVAALRERRRALYEPDPAHCVACGRCYLSCPIERERLKKQ